MWFPTPSEIFIEKNESYSKSVFIGFTAPILNLPYFVWKLALRPVVAGIALILGGVLLGFPRALMAVFVLMLAGILGHATGMKGKTLEDRARSIIE